ncbi:MAG: alkyl sulfatase dimerization domain-containing protein [Ilumatobacteraceae bacterium]
MHPLELSTKVLDSGVVDQALNRVTNELSELADGLAVIESFSHCAVWNSGEGLVCFDTSGAGSGRDVVKSLRSWSTERVSHLVYTHGHVDHIGGSFAFAEDASNRGHGPATVVGHENVNVRIDRYATTNGWNIRINQRQFGGTKSEMGLNVGENLQRFLPTGTLRAERTFRDTLDLTIGDTRVEMHHARGETDDHLWGWIPDKKWLFAGDFVIWNYPNAGNPQKVQRYALEWAQALRRMIDQGPELLVPAHGLPIEGKARIANVLDTIASSLESVVAQVIEMMNAGETLDTIIHTVKVPDSVLAKPFMRPLYDEPEFVVRNIWRLYGGWWDGAPSRLKPAPDVVLGHEIAHLAGGAHVLMQRALELMTAGDLRLACHLADFAGWAEPDDPAIHADRATIYDARRKSELSLMSKGIFRGAARESRQVVDRHS